MYSKVKVAGHPIHPMLVGFPVACYTGTLVGFAVYAASGDQFWLNLAIALNVVGVGSALLAALPGLVDWAFGIPRGSGRENRRLAHASLNVAALALFAITLGSYVTHWNGPATGVTLALALTSAGVACTLAAGFLGWMLVQDYHVRASASPPHRNATNPRCRTCTGSATTSGMRPDPLGAGRACRRTWACRRTSLRTYAETGAAVADHDDPRNNARYRLPGVRRT